MEVNWIIILVALLYGFFLARYFYFFHNLLPGHYSKLKKNIISHAVLITLIILSVIVLKSF